MAESSTTNILLLWKLWAKMLKSTTGPHNIQLTLNDKSSRKIQIKDAIFELTKKQLSKTCMLGYVNTLKFTGVNVNLMVLSLCVSRDQYKGYHPPSGPKSDALLNYIPNENKWYGKWIVIVWQHGSVNDDAEIRSYILCSAGTHICSIKCHVNQMLFFIPHAAKMLKCHSIFSKHLRIILIPIHLGTLSYFFGKDSFSASNENSTWKSQKHWEFSQMYTIVHTQGWATLAPARRFWPLAHCWVALLRNLITQAHLSSAENFVLFPACFSGGELWKAEEVTKKKRRGGQTVKLVSFCSSPIFTPDNPLCLFCVCVINFPEIEMLCPLWFQGAQIGVWSVHFLLGPQMEIKKQWALFALEKGWSSCVWEQVAHNISVGLEISTMLGR